MLVVAGVEQLPVQQARAGDASAWDVLFRRYQLPLYVFVFELVRDEQTSLDIVQETFVSATRHIASLRENDSFGSWLFSIAHQRCLRHWRIRTRKEALRDELADLPAEVESDPSEILVRQEQEMEFMNQIEQLPLPQRSAVLLHYVEDFSLEEIADITGTSVGTVKSRLHYARKALRKLLEDRP